MKHTSYEEAPNNAFFSIFLSLPHKSKHSPQHPVLKHPYSLFLP